MTCTFGLLKIGLAIYPGLSHAGTIEVIDIGIPSSLLEKDDLQEYLLDESFFRGIIPRRDPESHKGTYGHLLIIAGSPGKTGAAAMAAEAAMRAGAGLVTLGIPETLNSVLETKLTEVMTAPLPDKGDGFLDVDSWRAIHDMLDGKTAIAIGPGLSDRDETAGLVYRVLEEAKVPLIVDADALNAISKNTGILRKLKAQTILTPHPGEMARLIGVSTQKIQEDRVETARQFSKKFGVIVVLKGARTIIAEPGGKIFINPTGNPGMASGGMGDVLTGLISGLAAQGLSPLLASQVSVFSHGLIGDLIAGERAGIGIMATDIIERIPETLEKYFMSCKKVIC
jgi:NAD(P)H-hydrate epimerase